MSSAPASFSTGSDSPVSIDSSTAEAPSITIPSTGTRSPGRTQEDVAAAYLLDGHEPLRRLRVLRIDQARLCRSQSRQLAHGATAAAARLGLAPARDQAARRR